MYTAVYKGKTLTFRTHVDSPTGCSTRGWIIDHVRTADVRSSLRWSSSDLLQPLAEKFLMQHKALDGRLLTATGDHRALEVIRDTAIHRGEYRVTSIRIKGKLQRVMIPSVAHNIYDVGLPTFQFEKGGHVPDLDQYLQDIPYSKIESRGNGQSGRDTEAVPKAVRWRNKITGFGADPKVKRLWPHDGPVYEEWSSENKDYTPFWWEIMDYYGVTRPTPREIVERVAKSIFAESSVMASDGPVVSHWFIGGSCVFVGAGASCALITALAMCNPNTYKPGVASYINTSYGRLYCKVLPYYYESPQHLGHRVMLAFVSKDPIHMEDIL